MMSSEEAAPPSAHIICSEVLGMKTEKKEGPNFKN